MMRPLSSSVLRVLVVVATVALVSACAQSERDDGSDAAPSGGASGGPAVDASDLDAAAPSSDAEMVPYDPSCDFATLECCPPRGAPKCVTLGETECGETRYCYSIIGAPVLPPGSDPALGDARFLACSDTCFTVPETFAVAYDPADPTTCYRFVLPRFPEGWIEVGVNGQIPPGMCGT
jgi:hypothetical protein